jgi:plasmid stabilization system protein ParE
MLLEAQLEVTQAAIWYDTQRLGLGDEFLDEFQQAVARIESAPFEHGRLEEFVGAHDVRRCLLKRFPYLIIFRVASDELLIVAVAHARREPFYWAMRAGS